MSDSSRPCGLQPTRLLRPWDFPSKTNKPPGNPLHFITLPLKTSWRRKWSTGVGCYFLLQRVEHILLYRNVHEFSFGINWLATEFSVFNLLVSHCCLDCILQANHMSLLILFFIKCYLSSCKDHTLVILFL